MAGSKVKRIAVFVFGAIVTLVVVAGVYIARNYPHHSPGRTVDFKASDEKVLHAIRHGLAYLEGHQEEDGNFVAGELAPKTAFNALIIEAFVTSPDKYKIETHPFLQKAIDAIIASKKKNGGMYHHIPGMSFSNYQTALAVVALKRTGDPRYESLIVGGTAYLKKSQLGTGDSGGIGYDPGKRPDLNHTVTYLEALDAAGVSKDDPAYKAAIEFVNNTQNRSESNKAEWAADDGGFIYRPGESPADANVEQSGRDGKVRHASYGTMTYAGLVSFIYANVDKNDPRVKSAWKWISKNYDLKNNPNMKDTGLYYYYRIMAKALYVYGERYVVTPDGVKHDWAKDLSDELISLQNPDGSWVNPNTSYLEDDRVLVTAYAVRALSICYEVMKESQVPTGGK